jgi:hypothetical protein
MPPGGVEVWPAALENGVAPGPLCDYSLSLLQSLGLSWGVPQLRLSTLYPWHQPPALGRVRRAWVIPPISVSENHKRLPYPLVQVRVEGRGEWSSCSGGFPNVFAPNVPSLLKGPLGLGLGRG